MFKGLWLLPPFNIFINTGIGSTTSPPPLFLFHKCYIKPTQEKSPIVQGDIPLPISSAENNVGTLKKKKKLITVEQRITLHKNHKREYFDIFNAMVSSFKVTRD